MLHLKGGENLKKEIRTIQATEIEVRANEQDERVIEGYASKFDSLSLDLGGFKEKVERGAFSNSLNNSIITALWNHNTDIVLGSSDDNLKVYEDDKGLRFELKLGNTYWDDFVAEKIQKRHVKGVSFGFEVVSDTWEQTEDYHIRTLNEVNLFEVSPTAFPAYPSTQVGTRSIEDVYNEFLERSNEDKQQMEQRSLDVLKKKLNLLEAE